MATMTGSELRRLRHGLGLTQAQMGERIGVTQNTVARWERGEVGIGEPQARLIRLIVRMKPRKTRKRKV